MLTNYNDYEEALNEATSAIIRLREAAEAVREEIEAVIDACETLEDSI